MKIKYDERPQRGLWAPGGYLCKCVNCGESFSGDKRARTCADCAYFAIFTPFTLDQQQHDASNMNTETPRTLACWRDGKWHVDEIANTSAKLERELAEANQALAAERANGARLREVIETTSQRLKRMKGASEVEAAILKFICVILDCNVLRSTTPVSMVPWSVVEEVCNNITSLYTPDGRRIVLNQLQIQAQIDKLRAYAPKEGK